MRWHDLTLTTVTPVFLGAANVEHGGPVPFPVASLRGALRYWLRALVGAHVGNRLGPLANAEAAVFGRAARDDADLDPRSAVLLRASRLVQPRREAVPRWSSAGTPPATTMDGDIAYLLGQGLSAYDKQRRGHALTRGYLDIGTAVPLKAAVLRGHDAVGDLFLSALWALRSCGGLGARVRRGFGTIDIDTVPAELPRAGFEPAWLTRNTLQDLVPVLTCVRDAMQKLGVDLSEPAPAGDRPQYPCFLRSFFGARNAAPLAPGRPGGSPAAALSELGRRLRWFRLQVDQSGNPTTTVDYKRLIRPYFDGFPPGADPLRSAALGLPTGFYSRSTRDTAVVTSDVDGADRRASPLWLRVLRDGDGWQLRTLVFKAELLPSGIHDLRLTGRDAKKHPLNEQRVTAPTNDQVDRILDSWLDGPAN